MMKKLNLVLLPGFQTNTEILRELLQYLDNYFNVYFIDLPGFNRNIPALNTISLERFVQYSQKKIDELKLDSYILGGISFGFVILCKLNHRSQCRGILAVEPYLGVNSLNISKDRFMLLSAITRIVNKLKMYRHAFLLAGNRQIEKFLTNGKEHAVKKIIATTDPRTYFHVAKIILEIKSFDSFKSDLPHVIIMNPSDQTLNYHNILKRLRLKVSKIKVLHMKMEHFPTDLSRDYFEKNLPKKMFVEITNFFNNQRPHTISQPRR